MPVAKRTAADRARYAHASRLRLLAILSPDRRCGKCGKFRKRYTLEVHHVDGRDWAPNRKSRWGRVAQYWREFHAGVRLDAWCRQCNAGVCPRRSHKDATRKMLKR